MKLAGALNGSVNVLIVGALGFVLLGPNGLLGNAITKWRAEARIRNQIAEQWPALTTGGARLDTRGVAVRMVEFSDYQCPFCQRSAPAVERFLANHPEVGVVYRHFPLSFHPAAEGAALAAICAEAQGRFQAMHRRLFETTEWQQDPNWLREAESAGVDDLEEFSRCLGDDAAAARLADDMELGRRLGISGTPTFVHEQGLVSRSLSLVELEELLGFAQ